MPEASSGCGCGPIYTSDPARLEAIHGPRLGGERQHWDGMLNHDDLKVGRIVQTHILNNPGATQTARIVQGPHVHGGIGSIRWLAIEVEVLSGPGTGETQFWYLTDFGALPDLDADAGKQWNQWQWLTDYERPRQSLPELVRDWVSSLVTRVFTCGHRTGTRH